MRARLARGWRSLGGLTRTRGRRMIVLWAVIALAGLGLIAVRDSSLVAVRDVVVVGLDGYYERSARAAVAAEARRMTTLHVDDDRLVETAASFVNVTAIETDADPPHGLKIVVSVRRPVARVRFAGRSMALDRDGAVIDEARGVNMLPVIDRAPALVDGRIRDRHALRLLTALAAAPDVLLRRVEEAGFGGRGMVFKLEHGPRVIFGDARSSAAKWLAASAVLSRRSSRGARYVDVRVPSRPAIGGLGPAPTTVNPETQQPATPTPEPAPSPTAPSTVPVPAPTVPAAAPVQQTTPQPTVSP